MCVICEKYVHNYQRVYVKDYFGYIHGAATDLERERSTASLGCCTPPSRRPLVSTFPPPSAPRTASVAGTAAEGSRLAVAGHGSEEKTASISAAN